MIPLSELVGSQAEPAPVEVAPPFPAVSGEAREIGGRKKGLEPTRYGDWEMNGRCIDF